MHVLSPLPGLKIISSQVIVEVSHTRQFFQLLTMRGKRKCLDKPQIFKKGCVHAHQVNTKKNDGKNDEKNDESHLKSTCNISKYLRLSPALYHQSAEAEDNVPCMFDHHGAPVDMHMLRPQRSQEQNIEHPKKVAEKDSYRIFHYGRVEDLWNIAISGHRQWSPRCHARLQWDLAGENQWGLGWVEKVICKKCKYQSPAMKMYDEVKTSKSGRKSGGLNRAVQVGLSHCMIGNSALRDLLLALNIPAPSESGMQKQANTVSQVLESVNTKDMDARLDRLVKQCEYKVGTQTLAPITVEGDARYNNPLGSSTGKTPYQPATQSVYTICENVTPQKQVIGLACKNKLCKKAESLRQKGESVTCPNHRGHCSANMKPEDSIGNEGLWAHEIFTKMFKGRPSLAIKYFTTDGDSRAFTGLQTVQSEVSPVIAQQMRDPRHLTENMRNALKKDNFSLTMFPGPTKAARDKQQASFALELSKRCTAEFETCHKKCKGDLAKMRKELNQVPQTLLLCYQGDCSDCNEYSHVCGSKKKIPWKKAFQQVDMQIYPTQADEQRVLACISMRLGHDILAKTYLNTSTQKSEAFNRALSRCNPKSVTLKRNFSGRIHSAAHLTNCGIAKSTRVKCAAVGAPLTTGTRVVVQLKKKDEKVCYIRKKMMSCEYKAGRIDRRMKRYKEYHEKKSVHPVHYQKGLEDNQTPVIGDHTYVYKISEGECPGTSGINNRPKRLRKGTLNN